MGLLLSRFKKEKTSLQLLEELQEEIEVTECDKDTTVLTQKKYVGKLILYSVFLYCLFAVSFYFLAFPSTFRDGALYIAPLVIMPVIVFVAQRSIKWYFRRKLSWNTEKLADLRARKKKILDEVMDKETFRVAREILEKFAPDQLRKSEGSQLLQSSPSQKFSPSKLSTTAKEIKREESTEIKTAKVLQAPLSSTPVTLSTPQPVEPIRGYQLPNIQPSIPVLPQPPVTTHVLSPSQKRRLVRPILDPVGSRGFVDRLIEHLVGDGPANRYALICSHCSSHNGMALKEEFEYISFRCAYCGFPNPSRRVMTKRNSDVSIQEVGSSEMINNTFEEKVEEMSETELLAESSNDSIADKTVDENETLEESKETKEDEMEKLIPEEIDDTHVSPTPDSNLSN